MCFLPGQTVAARVPGMGGAPTEVVEPCGPARYATLQLMTADFTTFWHVSATFVPKAISTAPDAPHGSQAQKWTRFLMSTSHLQSGSASPAQTARASSSASQRPPQWSAQCRGRGGPAHASARLSTPYLVPTMGGLWTAPTPGM